MKTIMLILTVLISTEAIARDNPQACLSACKAMGPEFKCQVKYIEGMGALMVVDRTTKTPSEKAKSFYLQTRDCFFDSGGAMVELHDAVDSNGYYLSCAKARTRSGFTCDKTANSESLRGLK